MTEHACISCHDKPHDKMCVQIFREPRRLVTSPGETEKAGQRVGI